MSIGPELLAHEERWLDSRSSRSTAGGSAGEIAGRFGGEDEGGLEHTLHENLIGVFGPIGAMG